MRGRYRAVPLAGRWENFVVERPPVVRRPTVERGAVRLFYRRIVDERGLQTASAVLECSP